jgi:acetyl-CoA C-acetyltransferase
VGNPVIVEAVRTPVGKKNGALSSLHPSLLLGHTQLALLHRAGVDPKEVGHLAGGCVTQVGEQAFNITRMAWLAKGLPYRVPAITIDCQCGSSQHANGIIHDMIAQDAIEVGIACGVEVMSRVGLGANTANGPGRVKPKDFPYDLPSQYVAAERIAAKHGFTRADLDEIGLLSQRRAAAALEAGHFAREIIGVSVGAGRIVLEDEGPRATTATGLAALPPILPEGVHTAGNTSQISDGAAAVLWMEESRARSLGLRPRARIRAHVIVGADPYFHIEGPVDATTTVLRRAGMCVRDIDLFEVNEAFASVVLAWARSHSGDLSIVNVNGGAIALGHPMGATGSRLIVTALHELERRKLSTALITMCCGGAIATATIIERV